MIYFNYRLKHHILNAFHFGINLFLCYYLVKYVYTIAPPWVVVKYFCYHFVNYAFFVKGAQKMYEIFEQLLQKYGVTTYQVSSSLGNLVCGHTILL